MESDETTTAVAELAVDPGPTAEPKPAPTDAGAEGAKPEAGDSTVAPALPENWQDLEPVKEWYSGRETALREEHGLTLREREVAHRQQLERAVRSAQNIAAIQEITNGVEGALTLLKESGNEEGLARLQQILQDNPEFAKVYNEDVAAAYHADGQAVGIKNALTHAFRILGATLPKDAAGELDKFHRNLKLAVEEGSVSAGDAFGHLITERDKVQVKALRAQIEKEILDRFAAEDKAAGREARGKPVDITGYGATTNQEAEHDLSTPSGLGNAHAAGRITQEEFTRRWSQL